MAWDLDNPQGARGTKTDQSVEDDDDDDGDGDEDDDDDDNYDGGDDDAGDDQLRTTKGATNFVTKYST